MSVAAPERPAPTAPDPGVPPRAGRPARPPKPPARAPRFVPPPPPLAPGRRFTRSVLIVAVLLIAAFLTDVTLFSQVQHLVSQQQLRNTYRDQLAVGTAPVSEGDFEKKLLPDGAPVAIIDIPGIGVHEVVVEGTDSATLKAGPGHRRDTVLPGQPGVSVVFGRAAAFGGPFSRIQELAPGDRFTVRTGQGVQRFAIIGLRYAGDPTPPALVAGQSRLVLETARGPAFAPSGIAYVDARLTSKVQAAGARQTTYVSLPREDRALSTDTRTVWALVFALQFLLAAQLATVWTRRRIGARKAWVVAVPVVGLAVIYCADQLVTLLPNLL